MKCKECQIETKNPQFCSRSCRTSNLNKQGLTGKRKTNPICIVEGCENTIRQCDSARGLCRTHISEAYKCQVKGFLNQTLQEIFEKAGNQHQASKAAYVRDYARRSVKDRPQECTNCGYSKHVEVCHVKAISSYPLTATLGEVNDAKNLVLLCPNCHWEFDHDLLSL